MIADPVGQEKQIAAGETQGAAQGNYRQQALAELNKPAPEKKAGETKKERRERERLEAVATIKQRAAADNAFVLAARAEFAEIEGAAQTHGRSPWQYTEEIAQRVLANVEDAIPLGDYSEFPGAPERPGACTLAGVPHRAFRRWLGERAELRADLARARIVAADTLADRHLHLARVALEVPWASDAVRVAGDILRWQASIRNRDAYGEQKVAQVAAREVHIHIGTEAPARRVEALDITESSQQAPQLPDATA